MSPADIIHFSRLDPTTQAVSPKSPVPAGEPANAGGFGGFVPCNGPTGPCALPLGHEEELHVRVGSEDGSGVEMQTRDSRNSRSYAGSELAGRGESRPDNLHAGVAPGLPSSLPTDEQQTILDAVTRLVQERNALRSCLTVALPLLKDVDMKRGREARLPLIARIERVLREGR
jgi:hypothetical protein